MLTYTYIHTYTHAHIYHTYTIHTPQYNDNHTKQRGQFFEDIYQALKKHVNFDVVKVVLVGRWVEHTPPCTVILYYTIALLLYIDIEITFVTFVIHMAICVVT